MKNYSSIIRPLELFSRISWRLLVVALFGPSGVAQAQQQFLISKVALGGEQAPGTPSGVVFEKYSFFDASLNAMGQAHFAASLTGPGIVLGNNDLGLWSGEPSGVGLLARRGDQAPGDPAGVTYVGPNRGVINAIGQTIFEGNVNTASDSFRLWRGVPGNVTVLAREGNPAPGTSSGVTYEFFLDPTLNASGQVAFMATLQGLGITSANKTGIWSGMPSSISLLAREGDPAPGTDAGVLYSKLSYASFVNVTLNTLGQTAFIADLMGTGITGANDRGLWLGSPGNLNLIARKGNQAPGTETGVAYSNLDLSRTLNSAGKCVFSASLAGSALPSDRGIWIGDSGGVSLVARAGDAVPGADPGVGFRFFGEKTVNASNRVAFMAQLMGPGITTNNDTGIWSGGIGSLVKIAREDENAPGAGEGTVFGSFSSFALNDHGDMVFLNSLRGPNITGSDSLWFADAAGHVSLILRDGDPIEIAAGDVRIVSFLPTFRGGSGDEDGLRCSFNDSGQLVFLVYFTDNSRGFFIAAPTGTPVPTPTPGVTPTPSASPSPASGHAGNISTRLRVETGDNVLIGGFIVTGAQPKRVILRAIGPSLTGLGVPDALANPILELHGPDGFATVTNDNWMDAPNRQAIIDSTVAPTNDFESAILVTLPANNSAYTAIVQGVNNSTGVGLVEVYDLDSAVDSKLANISTRGFVQTGDNVMIGGLIIVGQTSTRVIVRAIGPSLSVPGKLADPTLELRDGNGTLLQSDDNWRAGGQEAEIIATTIQPSDDLESAIVRTLAPGNYTAIVRGVNDTTGVALVEAYDLGPP